MKLILLLIFITISGNVFAKNKLSILVTLSPAGQFEANSEKIKGHLIKEKDSFKADLISLKLKTLKTGIDLRDEHLWEYLKTKSYPKAVLRNLTGASGKASANLEVNGVKKDVQMTYTEEKNLVHAVLNLKASEFNLPPKSYFGVGVEDQVQIKVTLTFKQK